MGGAGRGRGNRRRRGRGAGEVWFGAGLVGREKRAVALYVYGLAIEGLDAAAEPAEVMAVKSNLLVDRHEGYVGAGVGEGTVQAVGGRVAFHCDAGGPHGGVPAGDGGIGIVVVTNQEAGQVAGDGRGGGDAVGARGGVSDLVCHGQGEVGGEGWCLRLDPGERFVDSAVVALVASDDPRGLGRGGPPVDAHGVDGVEKGGVLVLGAAVGDECLAGPQMENQER